MELNANTLSQKSSSTSAPVAKDPLVKRKTLADELGQSTTTLWRWTRAGFLPKPIRLGKTVGWPRSVIDRWKVAQGWPALEQEG